MNPGFFVAAGQRSRFTGLLLAAMLLLPASLQADGLAELLDRVHQSHRTLNYSGVITYQAEDRFHSYKLVHRVDGEDSVELLEPLDSKTPAPVKLDHPLGCVHPGHQLLKHYAGGRNAAMLRALYQVEAQGDVMVAGRDGQEYLLQAQDAYRLSYRMVLDGENNLLLRSEMLNPAGVVIERFQFMTLELGVGSRQAGEGAGRSAHHSHPIAIAQGQQMIKDASWQPRWLPEGFTLADMDKDSDGGMSFTDGLAMFSVFVEPIEQSAMPEPMVLRRGATLAYTVGVVQRGESFQVTAVGEVPLATLQQVAQSLRRVR